MRIQPKLNFWQIWNVSFGFLGIQMGFALQSANVSRILSNLGADLHNLSLFWLAAPVMGLIVQPIVGAASDHTWNRFGRRGPYILTGAIFAAFAMYLMPNSGIVVAIMPPLIFGAIMFALMDGSFNITMQPFRALVADMVPEEQRTLGYSVQSFLINTGAVLGSVLPYLLTNVLGVQNTAPGGEVPPSVIWSFYIGGTMLLLSVIWTVFRTKEYPPAEYAEYKGIDTASEINKREKGLKSFLKTLAETPKTMLQLAVVQFFAWFALYLMWVYTTSAVSQHYFGVPVDFDAKKETNMLTKMAFEEAGNWVGIMFGAYSFFAAIFSVFMPRLARIFGRKTVYAGALLAGAIGYISMLFFTNQYMLLISMVGVGIAWAGILAMPYAILSESLPANKMGVYMGIFNFTIAGPQIISGFLGGTILKNLFHQQAIYILLICGLCMVLGAISVAFVKINKTH
jgi:maltose/moltooligosaccharide transporter